MSICYESAFYQTYTNNNTIHKQRLGTVFSGTKRLDEIPVATPQSGAKYTMWYEKFATNNSLYLKTVQDG